MASKAYYVLERFTGYKTQLVFADSAVEAAEKCRKGVISECVWEDGPHPSGINSVRRASGEDPNPQSTGR